MSVFLSDTESPTELGNGVNRSCPPYLHFDATELRSHLDRKPFLLQHNLCEHPLFALPRLLTLAKTLPETSIEYNAGKLPVNQDPTKTPRNGLSVAETIQRLEECQSWMVLKNVEQDPEYATILEACLSEVQQAAGKELPPILQQEAFIFLSSPGSITPYHVDPEYNFLLQISGTKTIHIFDGWNRQIISEEEMERYYLGAHRNMTYREEVESFAETFTLQPGQALHFPVTFPHWVKNGDKISISFSITFRNAELDRRLGVHWCNAKMRQWGWHPRPLTHGSWRDSMKYLLFRVCRKLSGQPKS